MAESGRLVKVGLGKETTRGTTVTPGYWIPQTSIDFQNKVKLATDDAVFGVLNKQTRSDIVSRYSEGKIGGYIGDQSIGDMLYAAFGSCSSAVKAGETVVYNSTFTQSQSNIPQSYSITREDGVEDYRYGRGMLKSLEIDIQVNDKYVSFNTDWMAAFSNTTTSDTVSYISENLFRPKHATFKLASAVGGLSGATAIGLKSLKLTITRDLQEEFAFGSVDVNEIYVTGWHVTGDCTMIYQDTTEEALYYANTQQALGLTLANTDVAIGSSSNPTIALTMPQVTLNTWSLKQASNNMVEQTFGINGQYSLTSAYELSCVLTNLVTSY